MTTGGANPGGRRERRRDNLAQPSRRGTADFSLKWLVFAGLALIILLPPFFRGLFFPEDQLLAFLGTGLTAILWWTDKGSRTDNAFLERPLDYAVLAMFGAYLLSTFVAVNLRGGIQGAMLYFNLFLIYKLSADLSRERRLANILLHVIFLAAVGVAVVGIAAATGMSSYEGAFVGGRINSTFQYPDSLAAYMGGAMILGVALWDLAAKGSWQRYLYPAGALLMVVNMVMAYSIGADLTYPVAVGVTLLFLPPGRRLTYGVRLAAVLVVGVITSLLLAKLIAGSNPALGWGAVFGGMLLTVGLAYLADRFAALEAEMRRKIALFGGGLLVAVGVGVLLVHPPHFLTHVSGSYTAGKTLNAMARVAFWLAALKIIAAHPLLGAGGGGWADLYFRYQNFPFSSTQVHNSFLQIWVEAGTVGFLAFLGIWNFFLRDLLALRRIFTTAQKREDGILLGGIAGAVIAVGLHSAIDFDLSLACLAIYLWVLFGIVRGMGGVEGVGDKATSGGTYFAAVLPRWRKFIISPLVPVLLAGAMSLGAGLLWVAHSYAQQANVASSTKDFFGEVQDLQNASKYDPWEASYLLDESSAYQSLAIATGTKGKPNGNYAYAAVQANMRAAELRPESPMVQSRLGMVAADYGYLNQSISAFGKALDQQPLFTINYSNYAQVAIIMAQRSLQTGHQAAAKALLLRLAGFPDTMRQLAAQAPWYAPSGTRLAAYDPTVGFYAGEAAALLGDWGRAKSSFTPDMADPTFGARATMWLGAIEEKTGNGSGGQALIQKAISTDHGVASQLDSIRTILGIVK